VDSFLTLKKDWVIQVFQTQRLASALHTLCSCML